MSRLLSHLLMAGFFLAACKSEDLPGEPPAAIAGPDMTFGIGAQDSLSFTLDGSTSHDPDRDSLAFSWKVTTVPEEVDGDLQHADQPVATYLTRQAGAFFFELSVSDGVHAPVRDTVMVKVLGKPPVAVAGEDIEISLGEMVQLDASQSSGPEGQAMGYTWQLMGKPLGSTVKLGPTDEPFYFFKPDKAGTYGIRLVVTDADGLEAIDYITITVK